MTIGYNRHLEVRPSMAKLMWGNLASLVPGGMSDADLHSRLHKLRFRHYTAQCPGYVPHGAEPAQPGHHARPCTKQWPGQGGVQNRTQCVISHTGLIGYAFLLSWTSPSQSKVFADQFHLPQPNVFITEDTSLCLPDTSFISKCPVRLHSDSQGELFYRLFYRAGPTSFIC